MIVGIDNGVSGGVTILSDYGDHIRSFTMPIQRARKGNEIDVVELWDSIMNTGEQPDRFTFAVEEPGGSKSSKAATSMAGSFHAIRAMLELKGCRWHRVTPQEWQKAMIPGAKGDTKPRALAKARQLWPNEKWLATDRCRTPHDGMIDAALIAEYVRLKLK